MYYFVINCSFHIITLSDVEVVTEREKQAALRNAALKYVNNDTGIPGLCIYLAASFDTIFVRAPRS